MTRLILFLACLALFAGCAPDEQPPTDAAVKTVEDAKGLSDRATPLREEVDEVAAVRDEIQSRSPK